MFSERKLGAADIDRFKMLEEDEEELHRIIQDAKKFLGKNLLKNT